MTPIFLTSYNAGEIKELISRRKYKVEKTKKVKYLSAVISFDIETSSFYDAGEKRAIMYCWQSLIDNDLFIMGRTYDDMRLYFELLTEAFDTSDDTRTIVWVHNLGYEFQFIRKWIEWSKVFAVDKRTPVYAVTTSGIEFRCSYILSGYSLANLARQVGESKKVGDLNYSLLRTPKTPLTEKEIGYCFYDCLIVNKFILKEIRENGGISKIPLTKTGYVRRYCRNECYRRKKGERGGKYKHYRALMETMQIDGEEEYAMLKRAFQGGFTHANCFAVGKVFDEVASYDLTSSYPTVMLSEKFPMRSGREYRPKNKQDFDRVCKKYCCIFDIELSNVHPRVWCEHPISASRCFKMEGSVVDNGCVVVADVLRMTITNIDWDIIKRFYSFDKIRIGKMRIYWKDYLPRDFLNSILTLYEKKTELKGVEGKEVEYSKSKEMINSCYGMTVTDIVRDEIVYQTDVEEWETAACSNIDGVINKYNASKNRFLYYPWGVFVTAYARRNLFSAILACGEDYLYSDTDSVKLTNADRHAEYFARYNQAITEKVSRCLTAKGIDPARATPRTITGKPKPLGVWDYEGTYSRFKTLGAKRYMCEDKDGAYHLTVAGLSKSAVEYIAELNAENPFEAFSEGLHIPGEETGKNTHTYIDEEAQGIVTDYRGEMYEYCERSFVHLEAATYDLSLSEDFAAFLERKENYRY